MKQMGRTHRHYYRIVAIDGRQPRDGKVIEELGHYDPHASTEEARLSLIPSRIKYWQSVGAKASDSCEAIFRGHLQAWEAKEASEAATAQQPEA
jgi:small subunit ribosomal protein S16